VRSRTGHRGLWPQVPELLGEKSKLTMDLNRREVRPCIRLNRFGLHIQRQVLGRFVPS